MTFAFSTSWASVSDVAGCHHDLAFVLYQALGVLAFVLYQAFGVLQNVILRTRVEWLSHYDEASDAW
jgi:hypothetical protein